LAFRLLLQPHDICEWLRLNAENRTELRYPELRGELPPLPANFEFDAAEPEDVRKLRAGNEAGKYGWGKLHWQYYLWSYYRHVEMVDGEIVRILQALRDSGRDQDTVIVFTSDHGEGMACHQMVRKSSPYDESAKTTGEG
jgi:choline-sulfatase